MCTMSLKLCCCCCYSRKEDDDDDHDVVVASDDEDNDDDEQQLEDQDLEETSNSLRAVGRDCYLLAKETIGLCDETVEKSERVVEFGEEIKSTLTGFVDTEMDSSAIDTIKDLIDGDHAHEAKSMAGDVSELAKQCLSKSIQLIDRMQDGVENLPNVVQRIVKRRAKKVAPTDEERELGEINVEPDVEELEECVRAVTDLKLITALQAGKRAYSGISTKTVVCKTIFEAIKKFAHAVMSITDAFRNLDVKAVVSKIKDIWRCIRLSDLMINLAKAAGRVIGLILSVFEGASGKLSELWAALKKAKDCLVESVRPASEVKQLCMDANDRSIALQEKTDGASIKTRGIGGDEPRKFITTIKSLGMVQDIREAIDIAGNMDEMVIACSDKVGSMVEKVKETYDELPDIITDGIPEMMEAGSSNEDPIPPDVQKDIDDLERAEEIVADSNLISAVRATRDGFSGVSDKILISRDMMESFQGFAQNISKTIDSFLGVWNLELARDKIIDICRIITLGDLMKRFAAQIKRLLHAIIAFLATMVDRLENLIPDKLEDVFDAVSDFSDNFRIFKR